MCCQSKVTVSRGQTMMMSSSNFELDYTDGSNGKLNFVYSVDNKERKWLIIEELTVNYMWASVMRPRGASRIRVQDQQTGGDGLFSLRDLPPFDTVHF